MSNVDTSFIPKHYMDKKWDKSILLNTHLENKSTGFIDYVNFMDKIHRKFLEGVPEFSLVVCSPQTYAKTTLMFDCMKSLATRNIKITPPIDTQNLKRIMRDSRVSINISGVDISYEVLINTPVVFVFVTGCSGVGSSYSTFDELKNQRAMYGKPTVLISNYTLDRITEYEYAPVIKQMTNLPDNENAIKYPVIVDYSPEERLE